MPDIQLTRPDGTKVAISTLRGKYTYVDVWATWCGPCCKEIPHLEKLVGRMAGQTKVQFVSLSVDSDVEAWKKKLANDNCGAVTSQRRERSGNATRGDRAWGNAVRAMVLMQMKRYAEALPYVQMAISLRPQMFDRSGIKTSGSWTQNQDEDNVFVYIGAGIRACPFCVMLSIETDRLFEANDYVKPPTSLPRTYFYSVLPCLFLP